MDSAPRDLVKKTAALARLRIDDAQAETLGRDFARILEHFRGLTRVEVEGVEPMTGATRLADVTRPDDPRPSLARERVLECAPDARDGFFAVPKTIGGEG